MRLGVLAAFVTLLATSVSAQDGPDYEAVRDLPIEQAMATLSASEGHDAPVEMIRYAIRKSLADLYYPVDLRTPFVPLNDDETVDVIREFETRAGLTVDGQLTLREMERLIRLAELSNMTSLQIGMGLSVHVYDNVSPTIYASGSWSMSDIAWPLNRSEIRCDITERVCTDAAVTVSAPRLSGAHADLSSYVVSRFTDTYEIQSWKGGILDAVTTSSCRRIRLTINTHTDLVSQTTEDIDPLGCEIPGSTARLDPIKGVRVATLIDTWEAQRSYQDSVRADVDGVQGPIAEAFKD